MPVIDYVFRTRVSGAMAFGLEIGGRLWSLILDWESRKALTASLVVEYALRISRWRVPNSELNVRLKLG